MVFSSFLLVQSKIDYTQLERFTRCSDIEESIACPSVAAVYIQYSFTFYPSLYSCLGRPIASMIEYRTRGTDELQSLTYLYPVISGVTVIPTNDQRV